MNRSLRALAFLAELTAHPPTLKNGDKVIARFSGDDVAGYMWHDGRAPLGS